MPIQLPLAEPAGIFSIVLVIILVAPFAAEKLRMPGIIGLALAGILVGPHGLNLIAKGPTIEFLGSIGLVYVFFLAGAELDMGQLRRERRATLVFTAFTLLLPFAAGVAAGQTLFGMALPSAILFGCLFSSYTLVAYPIVSKLGLARERSVATAVSAVIVTDTATMIVLAAVARYARGGDDPVRWAVMAASILAWAVGSALILPRAAALFFKKVKPDGTIEFVFIFALAFACAFASELAGLEPIIGAFYAGLLLNRFIPQSGVLMNRIKFVGDSLLVPFFMVYIGVIADPGDVFGDWGHLGVAMAMVALNLGAKWLAAGGAALVLKYGALERTMLFGLSVSHAAAVLAAALVGYELGLFSQSVLSGAVFLIIASCVVGSLAAERSGRKMAQRSEAAGAAPARSLERIMVAVSNPASIRNLVDLSFLLRDAASKEPIYPIAVVPESDNAPVALAEAENHLAQAVVQSVSAGLPVIPSTRVAVNVPEGILQAARENRTSTIVIGWNKPPKLSHAFFGNVIDHVIMGGGELVVVARIPKPVNNIAQVSLVLPPLIERHPGFRRGLAAISSLVAQTGARLTVHAQKPHGAAARAALAGVKAHGPIHVAEFDSWKSIGSDLAAASSASCAFALCSARPGESSWHPAIEKLPHRLGEQFPDAPLLLFYLPGAEEAEAAGEPEPRKDEGDLLARSLSAGRVKLGMAESAIVDGIRELLAASFEDDRRALGRLTALFTEIAQKQPIELEPGVLLLHAHVEEATSTQVFFGSRAEGFRLVALEESVKVLVILCAPVDQPPEEHLKTLSEIARLFKDEADRAKLGLGPSATAAG